jgi:hydroxypyruvate isomerase
VIELSRRLIVKGLVASAAMAGTKNSAAEVQPESVRKGRIKQSVARWCYPKISVGDLCAYAAQIGLKAIDLLSPEEFDIPRRYGLVCAMGYADAGTISDGLNRVENHPYI